ncbi:hypothetical protein [Carnobacterium jeotgali]|uniref:hypothetical protein n=1 Tax=Carnobacterium jeotgali TaxID=545534 RepID=UPI003C78C70B
MINAGDIIHCKLPFEDGSTNSYKRFFLVYETTDEYLVCLNISGIHRKEHKLLRTSNKELINAIPPMRIRSMIKLDTLYQLDSFENIEQFKFGTLSTECYETVASQKVFYDKNPATDADTLICSKELFDLHNEESIVS